MHDYLAAFEPVLSKVGNVGDSTLTSLCIAGLHISLKAELLTRHPASLCNAMALACQLSVSLTTPPGPQHHTRTVKSHNPRRAPKYTPPHARTSEYTRPTPSPPRREGPPRDYPIVRVSAAERAEKAKRGECFWCPEKYCHSHVCSKKFYALMGGNDEIDDDLDQPNADSDTEAKNMLISGNISTINVLQPPQRSRSIRLTGCIHDSLISALIDGASTHNFIKPAVAEKLSLPLNSVTPFCDFVGNDTSLLCNYACLSTPICLQGHQFSIDLYILHVEGPDVILGVQWLQELGDITKNYRTLSVRFNWDSQLVALHGEDLPPKPISYNRLFTLLEAEPATTLYELIPIIPPTESTASTDYASPVAP